MKVIVAGMPKTGTKTMNEALKILGFSTYDFPENYWYLHDEWMKIFQTGGTTEDFRKMYENVDACMDVPSSHYWEEIHHAFPESKVKSHTQDYLLRTPLLSARAFIRYKYTPFLLGITFFL